MNISKLSITIVVFLLLECFHSSARQFNTREYWLSQLDRIARPVITNLAEDNLKQNMPVALSPTNKGNGHGNDVAYLEAFARTLSGIAPWLNGEGGSTEEIELRTQYREWTLKAIDNAVNPNANDYMNWKGDQPLVDASFLALALIRCPWLWKNLDSNTKENLVAAFKITRNVIPSYNNWILFSAMIETFFYQYNLSYDPVRIDYALQVFFTNWYDGDGMFSDGEHFVLDYYNSYVIQPYLNQVLESWSDKYTAQKYKPKFKKIAARYAEIQERTINADGSYPLYGRSIVYRGAAFQHLADMALRNKLPATLSPEQVRCALTAVIKKTMEAPNTFTDAGWLNIGVYGGQPQIADYYNNTGSLYLCTAIFLPLGLPTDAPFWNNPDKDWTAKTVWNGTDTPADHSLKE